MQEINQTANPFPGLRPFESSETHLFFGRDGQSEELLRRLKRTRFLAVVGTSGSGKSSLVRAGLLPALQGGLMASAGSDWRIAILRPGGDPIGNLARALASPAVLGSHDDKGDDMQAVMAETTLRRSSLGLVDLVSRARTKLDDSGQPLFPDYENLLVVVDQFEELFRFKQLIEEENSQEDAAAFVKLLLEAVGQESEKKIYVVLTMRSDFLGDCSQFFELPEAINNGQYLIPRMTRDERREAISGPVAVGQGAISEPLVNQLLNDVGDNPDQLPILQHALMRTWDHWLGHRNGNPIDIPDYNAIGGMAEALSRHADEAYAELNDAQKAIAEKLFKGLTEKGTDNREIRRPMEVQEICELTGANEAAVIAVVEVFRREGRSFLMPPPTDALTGAPVHLNRESLIDISHESLIRNWERLKTWVDEEARSSRIYRRLAETAVLHKEGGAGLWRDPDLGVALTWREQTNPNPVWARRYHPEFPLAMSFLDASVSARDAQIASENARRTKEIRRTRLTALIFAVAFIFSLGMGVYAYGKKNEAEKALNRAEELRGKAEEAEEKTKVQATRAEAEAVNAKRSEGLAKDAEAEELVKQKEAEDSKAEAEKQATIARAKTEEATQQKQVAVGLNKSLKEQFDVASTARIEADARRVEAVQQKNLAVARQLRNFSESEWNDDGEGLVRTSLLAVESLKSSWTPEGYEALTRGLNLLPRPATGVWKADTSALQAITYSHNGKWFVTKSTDGPLRVWDTASHREVQHLEAPHDKAVHTSFAFSPDDRWLVMGLEHFARVWETQTWQVKKDLPNGEKVWSVAFSSDAGLLATASYHSDEAYVYETATWTQIAEIKPGALWVTAVAFIPNTRRLMTSDTDGNAKVWEITRPQQPALTEIKGASGAGAPLVFSSDGRLLATGGRNNAVELWVMTVDDNKIVKLTPLTRGEFPLRNDSQGRVEAKAFSPDGRYLVTANMNGTARVWDVASGKEITRVVNAVSNATFSPDGRRLVTGQIDGTIAEWMIDAKEAVRLPHGDTTKVYSVAYSRDNQWLATGSSDLKTRVFQTSDWREVTSMENEAEVSTVAFSPDSSWLISLDEKSMQMFETRSWRKVVTKRFEEKVSRVAFSPDGKQMIAITRRTVQVYVLESGNWREVRPMEHEGEVTSLYFSPDSKWLATKTAGHCDRYEGLVVRTKTRVWDLQTGEEVGWMIHENEDNCHKNPKAGEPTLWGRHALALESATWPQAIEATKKEKGEAESRDGQWKASIDYHDDVSLLPANTTGKGVAIPHEDVNDIDISPDGNWLATAGDDGTVRLWPLSSEGIIRETCSRLPRNLSQEDRKNYLGDPNFPDTCPGLPVPDKK
jgi:WD40 repeat protein/energy-coupling factor transporter ATP-binding protein EcfA2